MLSSDFLIRRNSPTISFTASIANTGRTRKSTKHRSSLMLFAEVVGTKFGRLARIQPTARSRHPMPVCQRQGFILVCFMIVRTTKSPDIIRRMTAKSVWTAKSVCDSIARLRCLPLTTLKLWLFLNKGTDFTTILPAARYSI